MEYYEYKINSFFPCTKDTFRERKKYGKTLEQMVLMDYIRHIKSLNIEYEEYVEDCIEKGYMPFTKSYYSLTKGVIFEKKHYLATHISMKRKDREYIESLSEVHTERKSYINQYFILWWKLYLKKKYKKAS